MPEALYRLVRSQMFSKWEGAAYHAAPSRTNMQVRGADRTSQIERDRAGADLVLTSTDVRSGPFGCVVLVRC